MVGANIDTRLNEMGEKYITFISQLEDKITNLTPIVDILKTIEDPGEDFKN